MNPFEEFEKGAGTYLKVVRFHQPTNPDGFIVLYLRPNNRFLLAGYWKRYEHSFAVGRWAREGGEIRLEGRGQLRTDDSTSAPDNGKFERVFLLENSIETPCLVATKEMGEWSLLGWRGSYAYVGQQTIINPDRLWLPKSLSAVDEWIEKELGP